MPAQPSDLWVSLYRGAVSTGISRYRLLGLISAGELRAQRVAGRTVIFASDLEQLVAHDRSGAPRRARAKGARGVA